MPATFSPMFCHHSLMLAQPATRAAASTPGRVRQVIRPLAILDVVRRRGRSWGLLAQYEENRLGMHR